MKDFELSFFKNAYNLYRKYHKANSEKDDIEYDVEKTLEGLLKLKQLDYLYSIIKELETHVTRLLKIVGSSDYMNFKPEEMSLVNFKIQLHTEHFYYTAFRLRAILRHSYGLKKKSFESIGIRDVRNHLIEHPITHSISLHSGNLKTGPILKALRPSRNFDFRDKGLHCNSIELRSNLESFFEKHLE